MHDKDYIDVEALIRQAYKMRDEAVGQMIRAGWRGTKRLVGAAFARLRERFAHRPVTTGRPSSNRFAHH